LNDEAAMVEASSRTTPCADDTGLRTKPYAQGGSALSLQAKGAEESAWPTPVVTDSFGARNRTAWRSDPNSRHHDGVTLTDAAWMQEGVTAPSGPTMSGASAPTERRGALNAVFVFWLMGKSDGWVASALRAMQSFRPLRKNSSAR
jgi:hypothetical protein